MGYIDGGLRLHVSGSSRLGVCVLCLVHGVFIISASEDRTLKMWDPSTGTCTETFTGHTEGVSSCCVSSADEVIMSASYDGTVKIWDVATGTCSMTLRDHTDAVFTCCLSSTDQFIASTSRDNTLHVWDVATGNCTHTFPDVGRYCALSADDQRIVVSDIDNHILRILNIETGEIHTERVQNWVRSVCWSSNNQFLVLGTDGGLEIRDLNTLQLFNLDETDSGGFTLQNFISIPYMHNPQRW